MKIFNILKHSRRTKGFAIIQGLIIAGLVAGASAMVVNYTSQQQQNAKKVQGAMFGNTIAELANNILLTKDFCDATLNTHLGGAALSGAGGVLNNVTLRDANGTVLIDPDAAGNTVIRGVRINNISIQYPADGTPPWAVLPAAAGGGMVANLVEMRINISYGLRDQQLTLDKVISGNNLPMIRKVGGVFQECIHNQTSNVSNAVQANCERMGGRFNFLSIPQCELVNVVDPVLRPLGDPIIGTNQNRAGYSTAAAGLQRTREYLDNRFLRLDSGGAFQPGKGMSVDTLTVTDPGTTPSSLINIRQLRQSIQTYCSGTGMIGVFTNSGLRCVNLQCNQGEYLDGIDSATGVPICKPVLSGNTGCPAGEFYQLRDDGTGRVELNCCEPNPGDPNPHICDSAVTNGQDLGIVFPNPNGCGTCVGTRTNTEYTCLLGTWEAGGSCGPTNSALCASGNGVQGEVACCSSAPPANCAPPTPTFQNYTCSASVWSSGSGSCNPGPNSPECFSSPANDGITACCSADPTTVCGNTTPPPPCNDGVSCTADLDCGGGGTCSGGASASPSCYISSSSPGGPTYACIADTDGNCVHCGGFTSMGQSACENYSGYSDPMTGMTYTCAWGGTGGSCVCPSPPSCVAAGDSVPHLGDVGQCCNPGDGFDPPNDTQVICDNPNASTPGPAGPCTCFSGTTVSYTPYRCESDSTWQPSGISCSGPNSAQCSSIGNLGDIACCDSVPTTSCNGSSPSTLDVYTCQGASSTWSSPGAGCSLEDGGCSNSGSSFSNGNQLCCTATPISTCAPSPPPPGTCRNHPAPIIGQTGHSCPGPGDISCNYGGTGSYGSGYTGGYNNCEPGPACGSGGNLNPPPSGGWSGGYTTEPAYNDSTGCTSGSFTDLAETSNSPWRWNCGSTLCTAPRTQKVFFDNTPFDWTGGRVYDASGNVVSGATESSCPSSLNGQERYLVRGGSTYVRGEWYVARCNGSGWSRSRGCSSANWCGDNTSPTDEITATTGTRYLN